MIFFHINVGLSLFFFLFFHVVYHRPVTVCFMVDLLRQVVMLSIVNFFVVFKIVV